MFKTDKIANLHGHEVLRTPVSHCELNPIELIWAQVKGFVAENNTTFRLPACKTINLLPFPEGIFGASEPSTGNHM
jgi:hypothetical protein